MRSHIRRERCEVLYMTKIAVDYFVVRTRAGDPDVTFTWRLSATRKGYAGVRLEEVETAIVTPN